MNDRKVSSILREARDYIAKGFTKNALARDDNGYTCFPLYEKAVQWCERGALIKAVQQTSFVAVEPAERWLAAVLGFDYESWEEEAVVDYNNNFETTQADMLDVFDTAIFMCELDENSSPAQTTVSASRSKRKYFCQLPK